MDKDRLKAFFAGFSDKKSRLLLFLGFGGMLLIFLSGLLPEKSEPSAQVAEPAPSAASYAESLGSQLASFISSIDGAGETKVFVTVENNGESRYLKTETVDQAKEAEGAGRASRSEEYVLVEDGNSQSTVLISTAEPEIRGVAVICEGGGNAAVQTRVIDVVTTLLHISSARVSVSKMAEP